MVVSAAWALQKALYDHLAGDAGVIAALGGSYLFDDVPQGQVFPYVTIGEIETRDWSTADHTGHEHIVTMHIWTRAAGRKELQAITAALHDALHDQLLTLQDHTLINLRFERNSALRERDGKTYHGEMTFRAVTEAGF